jgi:hypothetical protein
VKADPVLAPILKHRQGRLLAADLLARKFQALDADYRHSEDYRLELKHLAGEPVYAGLVASQAAIKAGAQRLADEAKAPAPALPADRVLTREDEATLVAFREKTRREKNDAVCANAALARLVVRYPFLANAPPETLTLARDSSTPRAEREAADQQRERRASALLAAYRDGEKILAKLRAHMDGAVLHSKGLALSRANMSDKEKSEFVGAFGLAAFQKLPAK